LLLPGITERYAPLKPKLRKLPPGGDHGACAESGKLSEIDDSVPLFCVGTSQYPTVPRSLEEVADWLLKLL
jgi:hypothetical protein